MAPAREMAMSSDMPETPQAFRVDVSDCPSPHSTANKLARVAWGVAWALLYRPTPKLFHAWRRMVLRCFGARLARGVVVHPSARIWAPWNLRMGEFSCLGPWVDCYCVAPVRIGAHATVSQYSFLCTASHDMERADMPLITAPIEIGDGAWVAADVFVGPGVKVGEGAVLGARSTVFKDVAPWTVVAGNPARVLRRRVLKEPAAAPPAAPPAGEG
jgi:putative colanic acid biosynthesis acetyltransferase WcaF